jgi:hypothetical protein
MSGVTGRGWCTCGWCSDCDHVFSSPAVGWCLIGGSNATIPCRGARFQWVSWTNTSTVCNGGVRCDLHEFRLFCRGQRVLVIPGSFEVVGLVRPCGDCVFGGSGWGVFQPRVRGCGYLYFECILSIIIERGGVRILQFGQGVQLAA